MKNVCYSYIRFSTPEQIKGDSLRRQYEMSKKYAEENNLFLDDSLTFHDFGTSAFKGKNRTEGALKTFIELLEQGVIEPGSVLIVESFDRLSREKVSQALRLFLELIEKGITLITLTDQKKYSKETIDSNSMELMYSLIIMSRAHEESLVKSQRIRASWGNKRKNIHNKKLTGRCPEWLELSKDKKEFDPLHERVKIVNEIFTLSSEGVGMGSIAKRLNERGTPEWERRNGWRQSYISKILHSRAVLGEFTPREIDENENYVDLDTIENYFPKIISEELFAQVQQRLKRQPNFGGRNGKINNLFGGISYCGYCGGKMQFVNKGKPPKANKYLVCDKASRGIGCEYISYRYPDFENAFLSFCQELNIHNLISESQSELDNKLASVRDKITVCNERLEKTDEKISRIKRAVFLSNNDDSVITEWNIELAKSKREKTGIETKLDGLIDTEKELSESNKREKEHLSNIKELLNALKNREGDELKALRFKLRNEIRKVVEKIEIFPSGRRFSKGLIEQAEGKETESLLDWVDSIDRSKKSFLVAFKNGNKKFIEPDPSDPMSFKIGLELTRDKLFIDHPVFHKLYEKGTMDLKDNDIPWDFLRMTKKKYEKIKLWEKAGISRHEYESLLFSIPVDLLVKCRTVEKCLSCLRIIMGTSKLEKCYEHVISEMLKHLPPN